MFRDRGDGGRADLRIVTVVTAIVAANEVRGGMQIGKKPYSGAGEADAGTEVISI